MKYRSADQENKVMPARMHTLKLWNASMLHLKIIRQYTLGFTMVKNYWPGWSHAGRTNIWTGDTAKKAISREVLLPEDVEMRREKHCLSPRITENVQEYRQKSKEEINKRLHTWWTYGWRPSLIRGVISELRATFWHGSGWTRVEARQDGKKATSFRL